MLAAAPFRGIGFTFEVAKRILDNATELLLNLQVDVAILWWVTALRVITMKLRDGNQITLEQIKVKAPQLNEFSLHLCQRMHGFWSSVGELTKEVGNACSCATPTKLEVVQALYRNTAEFTARVLEKKPESAEDASILPHLLKAIAGDRLVSFWRHGGQLRIAPVLLALHFDLDQLDEAGNTVFQNGQTYQVGPRGQTRNYHQPVGWTRYGFKVLGKYDDDTWLHPFQHENNWYRGFHGTLAAKDIADEGFKESAGGGLGAGVYVSPFVQYAEGYPRGGVTLETHKGKKIFLCVLQVAVKPNSIMREGYPNNTGENQEWTTRSHAVRPYGLLIKEV